MKLKLIIFDLIRTLVFPQTKKSQEEFFEFYKSLGIRLKNKDDFLKFKEVFSLALRKSKNWKELGKEIIKLTGIREKEKAKKLSDFLKENLNYQLFDDSSEILNLPFKKAILTNAPYFLFSHLSLEKYFRIFTPKETEFLKPNPKAFLKVLDFFKIQPQKTMMVGDEIERDVIPAQKLGIKTILIDRGNKIQNYNGIKISSLKELKNYLD
jgi:putative hydrolase of the HAD superfamily